MASVAGVRRLQKSGIRACSSGSKRLAGGSASGRNAGGVSGIPRRPGSAARADGIRFGRKDTAEPSGRGASGRRRFCRRSSSTRRNWSGVQGRRASVSASKIRPGPGSAVEADVRTRIPSAPAPSRHRKSIKETPLPFIPRDAQPLPYLHASTDLGGVHSSERRSASHPPVPENLRPSTRHRAPVLPSILTSTKLRINKTAEKCANTTAKQHNKGFAKQHNSKTRGA